MPGSGTPPPPFRKSVLRFGPLRLLRFIYQSGVEVGRFRAQMGREPDRAERLAIGERVEARLARPRPRCRVCRTRFALVHIREDTYLCYYHFRVELDE